jgi:hypothetical protein
MPWPVLPRIPVKRKFNFRELYFPDVGCIRARRPELPLAESLALRPEASAGAAALSTKATIAACNVIYLDTTSPRVVSRRLFSTTLR